MYRKLTAAYIWQRIFQQKNRDGVGIFKVLKMRVFTDNYAMHIAII